MQQVGCILLRLRARHARAQERLGHHVERRHPRNSAQELADIANGAPSQAEDLPWRSAGDVNALRAMVDENLSAIAAIVAKDHLQDG